MAPVTHSVGRVVTVLRKSEFSRIPATAFVFPLKHMDTSPAETGVYSMGVSSRLEKYVKLVPT